MMKRFFLLLLAVAAITATASAQNTTVIDSGTSGSLTWELTADSTLTISGEGAMLDYNSSDSIPWSDHKHVIKKVIIQEGITSIGNGAFYGCEALTSITLPESLTSIGEAAFANCRTLIGVTIPPKVKMIGAVVWANCNVLTDITVAVDNPNYISEEGVLFDKAKFMLVCYPTGKSGTTYVVPDGVKSIGNGAFVNCKTLISITLPESLISIENGAFYGCEALKDITIPKRVRSIEDKAFAGTALIDVTLPRGVKRIGEWTFAACTKLKSITLPESLTHVENYAFWNCTSLISVTCLATTPPPLGRHYNFEFNSSDTLYVPAGSVEAYRKSGWSKAFTTITAIP